MRTLAVVLEVLVSLSAAFAIPAHAVDENVFLDSPNQPKVRSAVGYEGGIIEIQSDGTITVDAEPTPDLAGLDRKLARWIAAAKSIAPRILMDLKIPSNDLKKLKAIILVVRKHTPVYDVLIQ